jgi:hypothetical protein
MFSRYVTAGIGVANDSDFARAVSGDRQANFTVSLFHIKTRSQHELDLNQGVALADLQVLNCYKIRAMLRS